MASKIRMSELVGNQLKEFRVRYKVKAKDVAELIGKSPAYISKLEKGQIQQIDKKELIIILNYITQSTEGYSIFCEEIAEQADQSDLDNDIMLLNFDLVERKIPVPEDVVSIIQGKLKELKWSPQNLANYINGNEDLGGDFFEEHRINIKEIPYNVWIEYIEADSLEHPHSFIFLNYSKEEIQNFLDGNIKKCGYIFPYAMVYHLCKEKYKRAGEEYGDKLVAKCKEESQNILLESKFYSLSLKTKISAQIESMEEYKNRLSKFDSDNMEYFLKLMENISYLSQYDIAYTNQKLEQIIRNFEEGDRSFTLAFMATPLLNIKKLQPSQKREMLTKIEEIVEEYAELLNIDSGIERY